METPEQAQKRLDALLAQRNQCFEQHTQMSLAREALGAKINAIDGAIETLRAMLGTPEVPPKPPGRKRRR